MRAKLCLLIAMTLVLVACGQEEVVSQLSQYEANEVMVLLHENGIKAEITKITVQSVTTFGVAVDKDDLDAARSLLSQEKTLRPKEPGLQEIFKETGFIPTPQEQKAKVLVSLKGDIINALVHKIPDVIDADVLINIPDPEEFGSEAVPEPPSASVIVKVRPTDQAMDTVTEAKLQRFVANAVERLDPRNVTVIITYTDGVSAQARSGTPVVLREKNDPAKGGAEASAEAPEGYVSIAGLTVRESSMPRLKLYLGVFLGILALLALGLIMMVLQSSRTRAEPEAPALPEAEGFPQLEAGDE